MMSLRRLLINKKIRKSSEELRRVWLEEQKKNKNLSARDLDLLDRASSTLVKNIMLGDKSSWGELRGVVPSPGHYMGVWNWDCAFHAYTVSRFDPSLAYEQCEIFINNQLPDGMFPDVLNANGKVWDNYSKPPVFPWAFVAVYKRAPNTEKLRFAYEGYRRNENFWRTKRFDENYRMFFYDATKISDDRTHLTQQRFETGMDDSPRWDKGVSQLLPVDLNAFMVMFYDAMAFMAKELGKADEVALWEERRKDLNERINAHLWSEETGMYLDFDRFTGELSPVLSSAHLVPLYAGCADAERARKVAEKIADKRYFFPVIPTVAFCDPTYQAQKYWRGPVWLNYAFWAVEGLKKCGFDDVAEQTRQAILEFMDRNKRSIFEYYDSQTGKGLGAKNFGWSSAFLIELICDFS